MTYDELLRLYTQAGGNLNAGGYGGDDFMAQMAAVNQQAVYVPGVGYVQPDGAGGLQVANRFDNGGEGGSTGYTIAPGGTAQAFNYADPNPAVTRELGMGLVGGLALGGLGMEFLPGLMGGAGGAASSGLGAGSGIAGAIDGMMAGTIPAGGVSAMGAGAGLGAGSGIAGAIDGMMSGTIPSAGVGAMGAGGLGGLGNALSGGSSLLGGLNNGMGWAALLGGAAGLAGNGDISSTNTTAGNAAQSSSSSTALAPWLQGFAQDYVGRAANLANGPTTNANLSTAGGLLSQYATQGNPLVNQAMSQQANVIGGGLLGGNPYIDSVARGIGDRMGEAYATGTRAGTFAGFNNDGNSVLAKSGFGQTLGNQDRAFADSLGQTMNSLYFGNYQNERAAQDAASRNSINLANFGVNNAQNLANFGAAEWQRPFFANAQFGQAVNPAFGSTQTGTQTGTTNQTQTQNIAGPNAALAGLGGAMAGAGLYRNIFGGR